MSVFTLQTGLHRRRKQPLLGLTLRLFLPHV